jgi:catalase
MNHHRDGQKRHTVTKGKINYFPNRESIMPAAKPSQGAYMEYPEKIVAMKQRLHSTKFGEHFNQAQLFYNSLSEHEKAHLTAALSFELDHCDDPVVYKNLVTRLCDIDLDLAKAVAEKVGALTPTTAGRPNHGRTAKGLSQLEFTPEAQGLSATIVSRTVAIIIADGFNREEYEAVKSALLAAGAFPATIGPKRQPVIPAGAGTGVMPDHHFEGMRSTLFDSLYVPGGDHVHTLLKQGRVVHWVREAFGHCKPIGATGEAVKLIQTACGVEGMKFCTEGTGDLVECYGVVTARTMGSGKSQVKKGLEIVKGAKNFLDAYAYNISQHRNFQREMDGLTSMVAY